tara:strand:+ start:595 stop:1590 length:996 start_codon:yes stop_codon:yes gene_type:complete
MKKTKVVITGGAGFIGSHLCEFLKKMNYSVVVIDDLSSGSLKNIPKGVKFYNLDISKKNKKFEKIFDNTKYVFHLAALADIVPSIENPYRYYDVNVTGTLNVLSACLNKNVKKVIYAASSSCYGIPLKFPTNENSKLIPQYPYALTKMLGEQLVKHWGQVYKLKFTSLRLFNVYGTRARTSGGYGAMFGVFLAQLANKKPFTVVGNGNQKRDFTYVTDVCRAFYLSAIKKKSDYETLNVGSDNPKSVNYIIKILDSEAKKIYLPKRPGEPDITFADTKKIKKILNWSPLISIEKGILILKDNIDLWKKAPLWNKKKIAKATKLWFRFLKDE